MKLHKIAAISLASLMLMTGCQSAPEVPKTSETVEGSLSGEQTNTETQEMLTLDDINVNDFKQTAKISYTIEGKMVSQVEKVTNILEGAEYEANPETDVILKGTVDELWVAPLEKVIKTYTKEDGSELTAKDFEKDTYITLQTKEGKPVFAAFVPKEQQVEIHTAWGDVLIANRPEVEHGAGDYIVCDMAEDGKPNFEDVWVVNGKVFETTYDMSNFK